MRVGIISDTHGLLRPEVFERFAGVDHILHAGDVGPAELLIELEAIAPVTAVWGNTDGWDVRERVPEVAQVELEGVRVVVIHGQQFGSPTPAAVAGAHPGAGLVVFGHSHKPLIERVGGTLAVNPGSAGARRFRLPVSVALATLEGGRVEARLETLLD
jgi:putative phosphoesterase